jgi:hypothetical protein
MCACAAEPSACCTEVIARHPKGRPLPHTLLDWGPTGRLLRNADKRVLRGVTPRLQVPPDTAFLFQLGLTKDECRLPEDAPSFLGEIRARRHDRTLEQPYLDGALDRLVA